MTDFLIETDILAEHLAFSGNGNSVLEKYLSEGRCFTTVLNSAELIFSSENGSEKENAVKLLSAIKVIGIHSRYSLEVSEYKKAGAGLRESILCVTARYNRLSIVTRKPEMYKNVKSINIITPKD